MATLEMELALTKARLMALQLVVQQLLSTEIHRAADKNRARDHLMAVLPEAARRSTFEASPTMSDLISQEMTEYLTAMIDRAMLPPILQP